MMTTAAPPPTITEERNEWVLLVQPKLAKSTYQLLIQYKSIVARGWHFDGRYGSRTHRYMYNTNVTNNTCIDTTTTVITTTTQEPNDVTTSKEELFIGIPIRSKEILLSTAFISNDEYSTIRCRPNNPNDDCNDVSIDTNNTNNNHPQHIMNNDTSIDVAIIGSTSTTNVNSQTSSSSSIITQKNHTIDESDIINLYDRNNELQQFLIKECHRIHIIYKPYSIPTNRNLNRPIFDGTIHPERKKISNTTTNNECQNIMATSNIPTLEFKQQQKEHTFTYIELFAGIGGFGMALEALGGKCLLVSEIDPSCQVLYKLNFPHNTSVLYGDIYGIDDTMLPPKHTVDIIVGGFPCQPFSSLGTQPGLNDNKGILFQQIVRILTYCQPKTFLFENVQGLYTMKDTFTTIVQAFEQCNYNVTTEVLDARCVTASSRKRLYFVGIRKHDTNTNDEETISGLKYEFPYIPDLQIRANDVITYEHSINEYDDQSCIDTIPIHRLKISDQQLERLNEQKYWKPAHLAWPDTTCNTLISHYGTSIARGHSQLVPTFTNPRKFTPRECARIMGFPNTFVLPDYKHNSKKLKQKNETEPNDNSMKEGNEDDDDSIDCDANDSTTDPHSSNGEPILHLKQQYRMFGNAVCPPLIAALVGSIIHYCPTISGYNHHPNWNDYGRNVAIALAYQATIQPKNKQ